MTQRFIRARSTMLDESGQPSETFGYFDADQVLFFHELDANERHPLSGSYIQFRSGTATRVDYTPDELLSLITRTQ